MQYREAFPLSRWKKPSVVIREGNSQAAYQRAGLLFLCVQHSKFARGEVRGEGVNSSAPSPAVELQENTTRTRSRDRQEKAGLCLL